MRRLRFDAACALRWLGSQKGWQCLCPPRVPFFFFVYRRPRLGIVDPGSSEREAVGAARDACSFCINTRQAAASKGGRGSGERGDVRDGTR